MPAGDTQTVRLWRVIIYAVAAAFVILGIAAKWQERHGFTGIVHFGAIQPRLAELNDLPLALANGVGYDGQYYAQLAVNPEISSPAVQAAMDDPRYRAQRMALPLLAHLLGAGRPWLIVNIYAVLNVAAWLLLGWVLHRFTRERGIAGVLIWAVCMLGLGAMESVALALTDLPAMALLAVAVLCRQSGKIWWAALAIALAGLTRETSLLAALLLAPDDWNNPAAWRPRLLPLFVAIAPTAAWALYLRSAIAAPADFGGIANFDWPGLAMLRQIRICGDRLLAGTAHYRDFFAPLAAAGFVYQAWFVFKAARTDPTQPWVRVAVPFALLFFFLGSGVWEGYWAVARACLPMTVGYCLLVPTGRFFLLSLLLPNLGLLHGLQRFLSFASP